MLMAAVKDLLVLFISQKPSLFPLPGATSTCVRTPSTRNCDTVLMVTSILQLSFSSTVCVSADNFNLLVFPSQKQSLFPSPGATCSMLLYL